MEKFMTVGVVGAGAMGTEIALVFALAGHPAIISDQNRGVADKALDRLRGVLERGVGQTSGPKTQLSARLRMCALWRVLRTMAIAI